MNNSIPPNMHYKIISFDGSVFYLGACEINKARQFAKSKKATELFFMKNGKWIKIKLKKG